MKKYMLIYPRSLTNYFSLRVKQLGNKGELYYCCCYISELSILKSSDTWLEARAIQGDRYTHRDMSMRESSTSDNGTPAFCSAIIFHVEDNYHTNLACKSSTVWTSAFHPSEFYNSYYKVIATTEGFLVWLTLIKRQVACGCFQST